jgi:hypothetical protein
VHGFAVRCFDLRKGTTQPLAEPFTQTATIASLLVADLQSGARLRAAKVAQKCERTPNFDSPDPTRTTGDQTHCQLGSSVSTAMGHGCVTGGSGSTRDLRELTGARCSALTKTEAKGLTVRQSNDVGRRKHTQRESPGRFLTKRDSTTASSAEAAGVPDSGESGLGSRDSNPDFSLRGARLHASPNLDKIRPHLR